jgi:hypothetical protein
MATTELVPQIPQEGIQKATQELGDVRLMLVDFENEAKRIHVDSPETFAEMGALLLRVRDAKKKASWIMSPLNSIAKTIKDTFRSMELSVTNKAEEIDGICVAKLGDYKAPEREATKEEEADINKKREKKGLPPVEVKPNIPKVAGLRNRVNYYAECEDFRALLDAYRAGTPAQRAFLQQFLMPNDKAIAAHARGLKDDAATMKAIPGTKAWHEESV